MLYPTRPVAVFWCILQAVSSLMQVSRFVRVHDLTAQLVMLFPCSFGDHRTHVTDQQNETRLKPGSLSHAKSVCNAIWLNHDRSTSLKQFMCYRPYTSEHTWTTKPSMLYLASTSVVRFCYIATTKSWWLKTPFSHACFKRGFFIGFPIPTERPPGPLRSCNDFFAGVPPRAPLALDAHATCHPNLVLLT